MPVPEPCASELSPPEPDTSEPFASELFICEVLTPDVEPPELVTPLEPTPPVPPVMDVGLDEFGALDEVGPPDVAVDWPPVDEWVPVAVEFVELGPVPLLPSSAQPVTLATTVAAVEARNNRRSMVFGVCMARSTVGESFAHAAGNSSEIARRSQQG